MKKVIKIHAFTLLESLITLMLISIIIALSYALIDLIGRQLSLFEKENTEILEYNLFNSTFMNDVNNANGFLVNENHIHLDFYSKAHIDYYILDDAILRRQDNFENSFKIHTINFSLVEEGRKAKNNLEIKLKLLKDTITTSYYFKENNAKKINKQLFNED
ncbi:type II secretion system protein [Psychroserpens mesophilus]|uniref:type II secretion system protein n=1 Tax=Psychroserpens mesophilus TaxID=325473 RepID=UPI00058DB372|nr:type II secretion system protein [Psychroserpens mesophilus]